MWLLGVSQYPVHIRSSDARDKILNLRESITWLTDKANMEASKES